MHHLSRILPAILSAFFLVGCAQGAASNANLPDDTSTSGVVGSVVAGSTTTSEADGTYAGMRIQKSSLWAFLSSAVADDSRACPMPPGGNTATTSGCASNGTSYWISKSNCKYSNSTATWNGVQAYFMSSGSASCTSFPNPGANGFVVKQYVNAVNSTSPGSMVRTSATGRQLTMDDASSNISNFNGDTISVLANGGYGTKTIFNSSGKRTQMQIAEHVTSSGVYDHSVTGTISVSDSSATSHIVSGSMTVYHNLLKVVGQSTLSQLVQNSTCCVPVSGSISTTYQAGSNVTPTAAGLAVIGKTETLTFTSCGVGVVTQTNGTKVAVNTGTCL